jgi:hypothetical protein
LTLSKKILKCKLENSWIFGGKLLILRSVPNEILWKILYVQLVKCILEGPLELLTVKTIPLYTEFIQPETLLRR